MSVSYRTEDDAKAAFQSCKSPDPKDRMDFYNSWAEDYEEVSLKTLHQSDFQSLNFCFCYLLYVLVFSLVSLSVHHVLPDAVLMWTSLLLH